MTATSARTPPGAGFTGRGLWYRRVEESADWPFLTWQGRTWTYAEADDEMRRMAGGLAGLGVREGTRVAVGMSNRPEAIFAHLALRELGAVLVALVPGLRFKEIAFQIEHSGGELLIADAQIADEVAPHLARFRNLRQAVLPATTETTVGAARVTTLGELMQSDPLPTRDPHDSGDLRPSAVFYTSGSTARPKGVLLPAGAIPSCGKGYAERFGIRPDDTFLLPFTVGHGVGGLVVPGLYLHTGCHVALEPKFSPSVFWQRVAETGATVSLLFPAQLQLLLKLADDEAVNRSLRLVITHSWNQAFHDRFGANLGMVWGSTETGANGAGSGADYVGDRGEGYIGPPLADEEITIVDPEGREAPVGAVGEIRLRHRHVMLEYLKDPDATARTLVDGWIHTGDYGSLDHDGSLYYRGRLKNMIKRSGENISPEEIEAVLLEHSGLVEAVAFGVPDPVRTEELAVVVVAPGGIDGSEVSRFVAERVARWKAPRYVRVVREPFARLSSGKIDRVAVSAGFSTEDCWDRERKR